MTRPWLRCGHFLGAEDRVCGVLVAHTYLTGPRCEDHTPARLAGRPESVPDPALTMVGLAAAAARAREARSEAARARAEGRRVFRPPSGRGGRYTGADVDYDAVRRAEATWGTEIMRRQAARPAVVVS